LINAFALAIDEIVYGRVIAAIAAAILSLQVAVIVMASRRRRPGRTLLSMRVHLIAGGAIAALPIATGVSVHGARASMFAAFAGLRVDPIGNAELVARGISGQFNAIPFGASTTLLALALWIVGAALTLSVRRPDGRARSLPPAALVVAGLVPLAIGAVNWSTGIIKRFADLAELSPEKKAARMDALLYNARTALTFSRAWSMMAVGVLAVVAVVLIIRRGSRADTAAPPSSRSARVPVALSAAALLLAALLMIAVRPFAAENQKPWPPTIGSQFVWSGGPATPDLVGPDPAERAPVVSVFRDGVKLDTAPIDDLTDLELKLGTLANNYKLLHPGGDFNEMALIEVDAATSIARLASVLRAVRGAWYYHPMFVFTERQTHVRPAFGTIERVVATGARCRLAYVDDQPDDWDDEAVDEWKTAVPLRLEDFADYGAFARRLVELRRAGKPVLVKIARAAN
jgi:hypothetical protein